MVRKSKRSTDVLQEIPGIGPSLAADLRALGYSAVDDLRGQDPLAMYERLCSLTGARQDRCVLYVFRCAVFYAEQDERGSDPAAALWWNWKDRIHPNEH